MDTKTCQVCGRSIKAKSGVIAHHGYTRPYEGWQTKSCAGARYLPYEESCDRLKEVIGDVENFLERTEKIYAEFLENPPEKLICYEKRSSWGREEEKVYERPAHLNTYRRSIPNTYECAYAHRSYEYEQTIKYTRLDLKSMKQRLAEWKPC